MCRGVVQAQEGRAGAAHVGAAGEPAGADGAAGGADEAAEGTPPSPRLVLWPFYYYSSFGFIHTVCIVFKTFIPPFKSR